jgi:hypothetical protein
VTAGDTSLPLDNDGSSLFVKIVSIIPGHIESLIYHSLTNFHNVTFISTTKIAVTSIGRSQKCGTSSPFPTLRTTKD